MKKRKTALILAMALAALGLFTGCQSEGSGDELKITNVSYDPTRELYTEYNTLFQKHWKEKTGKDVEVVQSHGGSGAQARSVIEGNEADVVTLALEHDISAIANAGLIEKNWISEFDSDSSPYTSTIVFLVRKGNEKNIRDWNDLIRDDVEVITPNPKTSGGACWNFLAAWAYSQKTNGNNEAQTKEFMKKLYQNVLVLDSGARGATNTFVENKQGDVLLAWENEAYLSLKQYPDDYEIVSPSVSILAQPSVAVVDSIAKKHGTEEISSEYLKQLYSDEAQRLVAKHFYRPSNQKILSEFKDQFDLSMKLVTINDFGGWDAAYEKYFDDGAIFDQIYQ